jgi:hypothetical protein
MYLKVFIVPLPPFYSLGERFARLWCPFRPSGEPLISVQCFHFSLIVAQVNMIDFGAGTRPPQGFLGMRVKGSQP